MNENVTFPQEWPAYLTEDSPIDPILGILPLGTHNLSLKNMNHVQFEQFCWYLLKKDYQLEGCLRLGGNGKEQQGFDIFAYQKNANRKLIVFECKCWENFTPAKLKKTIDKFIYSSWAKLKPKFILILAQPTIENLKEQWLQAQELLAKNYIESEIWLGEDLTEMTQYFPDILTKFFPFAPTQQFCNEWMRRVKFLDRLSKALVDPREEISKLANEFINANEPDKSRLESRYVKDEIWSVKQPWFDIYVILPTERFTLGSASLIIKTPNSEGVTVILNHKWMLNNFLGNSGAPIDSKHRPFYIGEIDSDSDRHILELNNCRFILPFEGTKEIVQMADELSMSYFRAIKSLDDSWGTHNFPIIKWSPTAAVIGAIKKNVWNEITQFTDAHDYQKGVSEWHIFDHNAKALKPFTKQSNSKYNQGYHGIFYAIEMNHLSYKDEYIIIWQPPNRFGSDVISDRDWWSCSYVYEWLQYQLLPTVGVWCADNRAKKSFFLKQKIRKEFISFWKACISLRDVRLKTLLEMEHYLTLGVVNTIRELRDFYNNPSMSERAYFAEVELNSLLNALIILLKGKRGYLGYISSSLSISTPCKTHEDVICSIENKILNKEVANVSLDYTFRAMLEAIKEDESWISESSKISIYNSLKPFMAFHDLQLLIRRHTEHL